MITYRPTQPPSDPKKLPDWLREEMGRIQVAARQAQPFVALQTLHAEPARPFDGMTILADGTDWDPGSGAGVYCYYASAWNKLG